MKFQKIQNCFAEFFLIFSLIFSVIPAQLHYENLDLYFYLNPIFYLKILFIVIFLTILFTLIFYKYYSFITSILKISILGLILTGLLLPVGGQVDIMLKESYDLNPYFVNIFKFVFVLIFFIKVKQLAKFFIAIRYFVIFYFISIIFLLNIHIKHNYQNDDFEKLLEFSSVENLLILDFDGISNHTLLNELLLDEDTGGDLFKDFTYYSNAHSNATGTWISTNLEFFGNLPFAENIQNQKKHLLSIRENSKMINDKENYRVDVYGQYIRNFNGNVNRFYNSALNSDNFLKFYFYHFQEILLPSFNRYLSPHGVKLINSLIPNKKLNDLYQANNLNSLNFETYYDFLNLKNNFYVNNDNKNLLVKFLHFDFSHSPINLNGECGNKFYDKDWKLLDPKFQDQEMSSCLVKLLKPFIKKLKDKGIYDNTTIIIKSDHGRKKKFYSEYPNNLTLNDNKYFSYGRYRPALMIKNRAQIMNELEILNDQVFLSDLNQIYCKNKIVKCSGLNGYNFINKKFYKNKLVEIFLPIDKESYVNIYENNKILFDRSNELYKFIENK